MRFLYPYSSRSTLAHFSRVDIEQPDFTRYPKFKNAKPMEFTLEPGEMLYLPPFWWHQVESLEPAISVSFWWALPWTGYFARPALRLVYAAIRERLRPSRPHEPRI